MVELNTKRLRIVQLNEENFKLLLTDRNEMEKNLGLLASDYQLDNGFIAAMQMSLKEAMEDMGNFQWYTAWQIISKAENKIIGSIGFKGGPNQGGEVEVGYGINEKYEGNGFATEAVVSIAKWALDQKSIKAVIAETENDNIASQRVLEKNNFLIYKQVDNCIWWKLTANH